MDIMREFVCAAFLLSGISVLESGAQRLQADSCGNHARQAEFRLPWAVAPIPVPSFVACIHIEMEFGYFGWTGPALPSMYAPILLLIFVSITFACKEPQPKS